jgi:hypothetical protein
LLSNATFYAAFLHHAKRRRSEIIPGDGRRIFFGKAGIKLAESENAWRVSN